eukprot:scaffold2082_cov85-Cylindrotheca_fusiformis.AAC.4
MHPPKTRTISDDEHEVLLETPDDVQKLSNLSIDQAYRIRISQRLFGPPQWTLPWSQRRGLFQQLGSFGNLTTLVVHGTIMGQVIPGHALALSMSAPNLRILRVEAGMILDSVTYILDMAEAVRNHKQLIEFSLLNFLNHVLPVASLFLMDPLLGALSTISTLEVMDLRCLSSFMQWETSFVSSRSLKQLLTLSKALKRIELTNLGLRDEHLDTITANAKSPLQELVLNGNDNTKVGLTTLLRLIQPCWTKLEIANDVKMTTEHFELLRFHLARYDNQLQNFCCTYPIGFEGHQQLVKLQLSLHRLDLKRRYYSPDVTPAQRVQVLSEVMTAEATTMNLDHIYTLLREQPTLCDIEMNGINLRLLQHHEDQEYPWKLLVICGLWCLWVHYLALRQFPGADISLAAGSSKRAYIVDPQARPTTSLEQARARKKQTRWNLEQQMTSTFGPPPYVDSETRHSNSQASRVLTTSTNQRRLHVRAQTEFIRSALREICPHACIDCER